MIRVNSENWFRIFFTAGGEVSTIQLCGTDNIGIQRLSKLHDTGMMHLMVLMFLL